MTRTKQLKTVTYIKNAIPINTWHFLTHCVCSDTLLNARNNMEELAVVNLN